MKFSIVTPSFRSVRWLPLCIASVADQEGVEHEHIVQDSCSDDGTADLLAGEKRVQAFIEKDSGMYDAVNRGFRRSSGDILAYLNCDEQYLPGALRAVRDFFASHPEVDVVLPDVVVVQSDGSYLCHRYSLTPISWHIDTRHNVSTSSLFIRRRVFFEKGLWFDAGLRDLGDHQWIKAACERGLRWAELRVFASVFTDTGENMNLGANAARERAEMRARTPAFLKAIEPAILWHHRARMWQRGMYRQQPFQYEIYTVASPAQRVVFDVPVPTGRWSGRG